MASERIVCAGGRIFNGVELLEDHCAIFVNGVCTDVVVVSAASSAERVIELDNDVLSVGYTDLQVNGGGGVMLNDGPSLQNLVTIAEAHRKLGTVCLLPTLISDTFDTTVAAINAVEQAIDKNVAGIAGLHLEGPHLSVAKKGAHAEQYIRPMDSADLNVLLEAARDLPCLMVTVAPENVTTQQVNALAEAGVIVALGHTDASYDTCVDYHKAGARCVTHLFNAMSQLGSREPGLTGAAIDCDALSVGLIADGIHVHPASIRAAWNGKSVSDRFYLVTDAMAPAGTDHQSFTLNDRTIYRRDGRLTLANGTLAGADLDLTGAIRLMHYGAGIDLESVLRSVTTVPRSVLSQGTNPNTRAESGSTSLIGTPIEDMIRISSDLLSVAPLESVIR